MAEQQLTDEQAIVSTFQRLLEERDSLSSGTIDRQEEVAEHDLVIKTLEPLDPARRCSRLMGEVLVERTVGDVLPAVQKQRDNLMGLLSTYQRQLEAKQKEVLDFQAKYNIRIKGSGGGNGDGGSGSGSGSQKPAGGQAGVLVGS